jgi:hypothetical protein
MMKKAKIHLIYKWTHHQVPSLYSYRGRNRIYPIEMSIHNFNFKSVFRVISTRKVEISLLQINEMQENVECVM